MNKIKIKRVCERSEKDDGLRVLGDRLWPRGASKATAKIDLWAKDLAPSNELRRWFHKDKERRFKEFSKKYEKELIDGTNLIELKKMLRGKNNITLVTGVKDIKNSHIPALAKKLRK